MGNFSSCFCTGSSDFESVKLLDPRGRIQRLDVPIRVAELMLEYPGYFVSSLNDVRQTARYVALLADNELMMGKAYVMVPFKRMNSRATEDEMAAMGSSSCKRSWDGSNGRETFHDVSMDDEAKDENKGGDSLLGRPQQELQKSCYLSSRQWIPALEPIFED